MLTFHNLIANLDEVGGLCDVGRNGDDASRVETLRNALVPYLGENICSASNETAICFVRPRFCTEH
jgi:hypothetical protein